jgi:exopolysaccharide production protein ExoQ
MLNGGLAHPYEILPLESSAYRLVERLVMVVALMFFGDVGITTVILGNIEKKAPFSDARALVIQLVIYGLILPFLIPVWKQIAIAVWRLRYIFALVAFAFLSCLWSHAPGTALRRSPVLFAEMIVGVYFGIRFRREEQVRLVTLALGIAAFASLAVVLAGTRLATFHTGAYEGAWVGVFASKNTLGKWMSLEFLAALLISSERKLIGPITILLTLVLVYKSESKTSLLACMILLMCYGITRLRTWGTTAAAPVILLPMALVVLLGLWISDNPEWVLKTIGRDATLTGRTELWTFVLLAIKRHPWAGYGFNTFWMDDYGPVMLVYQNVHWTPPTAHNGLLELGLDLGIIGIVIFLIGFIVTAWKAFRTARDVQSVYSAWPLLYIIFLMLVNITETSLVQINMLAWVLYASVAASMLPRSWDEKGASECRRFQEPIR